MDCCSDGKKSIVALDRPMFDLRQGTNSCHKFGDNKLYKEP